MLWITGKRSHCKDSGEVDMSLLTDRETEVVTLLAQGKSQIIIARQLIISRHTVYSHVRNIREKTGTASAFEIAVSAAMQMKSGHP